MTIVANDSITVSNVNDGTITHTAWSYSADGTNGFTTVYPNLNLLTDSKDFKNKNLAGSNLTTSITAPTSNILVENNESYLKFVKKDGQSQDWFRALLKIDNTFTNVLNLNILPNTQYTFSFLAKGSGEHIVFAYNSWTSIPSTGSLRINLTNEWKLYTFTVTSATVIPDKNVQFFIRSGANGSEINIKKPKVEQGSIATPYMQSSSEVTTADWPKYIGHYTDFTQSDSTNPTDYTWGIMRGNDGISPTVKINPDTSLTIVDAKGTITTPVLKGSDGTSGIIVSSVAPSSPQTGQLWQDTSTIPQLVKKWNGSEWVIWAFYAQNLKADNISTISLNLGDMTGGTVKLMADVAVGDTLKKYGIYQSKLGLLSSGPSLSAPGTFSNSQMGVANLNRGELRFIVTDYTENLKSVQETGMSDTNNAFIKFDSYDNGKDVMVIGSSGDIVFKGNTSQDTPWITLSSGVKYKYMFSRVYISVDVVGNGSSFMSFGIIPQEYRPIVDQFLIIANWGTGTADDRHIMVRASDGAVILWAPKSGVTYRGEVSYTL